MGPLPNRLASALAAAFVASSRRAASRASISLLSGVPWQYATAASLGVEVRILERQGERVGLPPCDATLKSFRRSSSVKHWLIEIGSDHPATSRKMRCDGAGKNTGARGRLQQILRPGAGNPLGQIPRIG